MAIAHYIAISISLYFIPSLILATNIALQLNKKEVLNTIKISSIPFIENKGQLNKKVKFYTKTLAGMFYITDKGELVYNLPVYVNGKVGGIVLKEVLKNTEIKKIAGIEKATTVVNYMVGNKQRKWISGANTYKIVSLGKIYDGIYLRLKAHRDNIEKIFEIRPGADPEKIAVGIFGAKNIHVDNDSGELIIKTDLGNIRFTKPIAYQKEGKEIVPVSVNYKIISENTYSFEVKDYDVDKPLIIDPLLASTYIGGKGKDSAQSIAIDFKGNIYVVGNTFSYDFPTTTGAYQISHDGKNSDAFILKMSQDLSTILASTFLGGSDYDFAEGVAIDSEGNIYVTGDTYSSDFPTTIGSYQRQLQGGRDGFIAKISSDLSTLIASTLIGGNADDFSQTIITDSGGNIYISGFTFSKNFPTTANAYQGSLSGSRDIFISKFNNNLSKLLASTLIGGYGEEFTTSILIDKEDSIYVAGGTNSANFPKTAGAYQTSYGGGSMDAFISKLNSDLSKLLASTLLGGDNYDSIFGIAIDKDSNIYVTGSTTSSNFPTTQNAYKRYLSGSHDAFILKLNSQLSKLISSTLLGGSSYDSTYAITLDQNGNIYIAGDTESNDFPITVGAYQISHSGLREIFISKLNNTLSNLIASTFLGGKREDYLADINIDPGGNVYIIGSTGSTDFPTTSTSYKSVKDDLSEDIFITKISADLSAGKDNRNEDSKSTQSISAGNCSILSINSAFHYLVVPILMLIRKFVTKKYRLHNSSNSGII